MAKVSFGIGGYGSVERRYLATVSGDVGKITVLAESLQDCGFWTVLSTTKSQVGTIEIGEIITQKM